MAPKNTKQGASASGRRSAGDRRSGSAASSRTRSKTSRTPRTPATPRRAPATRNRKAPAKKPTSRFAVPRQWWMLPLAAGALIAVIAWTYYPVASVQYREARERARLVAELESLQARNARLREQVDRLKTPAGVEDYARSQLGLVKKGENVVVVVDGDEDVTDPAADAAPVIDSDEATTTPVGPWTAFLDLVFGLR